MGPVSTETHRMSVLGRGQGTARPQVANWWLVVGVFLKIHFLWLIQCWPTPCLNFFEFVSGIVKSDGLWFESTGNWPALGYASPLTTMRKRQPPSPPRPEHVLRSPVSGSSPTPNACSVLCSPSPPRPERMLSSPLSGSPLLDPRNRQCPSLTIYSAPFNCVLPFPPMKRRWLFCELVSFPK